MAEGKFWPGGYFPDGYWAEGYFPDGFEADEDGGVLGWWFVPELRQSMGFEDVPPTLIEIPATKGVIRATFGLMGLSARGRVLPPSQALKKPVPTQTPIIGEGFGEIPSYMLAGVGRADFVRGEGSFATYRPDALCVGIVGVSGKAKTIFGTTLRVDACMEHNVCTEEDLLGLVAVAQEHFDRMDADHELLLVMAAATQLFLSEPASGEN